MVHRSVWTSSSSTFSQDLGLLINGGHGVRLEVSCSPATWDSVSWTWVDWLALMYFQPYSGVNFCQATCKCRVHVLQLQLLKPQVCWTSNCQVPDYLLMGLLLPLLLLTKGVFTTLFLKWLCDWWFHISPPSMRSHSFQYTVLSVFEQEGVLYFFPN